MSDPVKCALLLCKKEGDEFKDVPGGFPKSDLLGVTVARIDRILAPCNYCHHPWCVGHKSYHKALLIMFGCDGISDHASWNEVFHYWDTKLSWHVVGQQFLAVWNGFTQQLVLLFPEQYNKLVLWQLQRQLALRLRNKSVISHLWLKIAQTPWHILKVSLNSFTRGAGTWLEINDWPSA